MLDKHSNAIHCVRLSLPLNTCKMVHISFSNVVHSILCSNLLLLSMNHMTRPESGYEVASCCLNKTVFQSSVAPFFISTIGKLLRLVREINFWYCLYKGGKIVSEKWKFKINVFAINIKLIVNKRS